jgi:tetratricopeptide (TPR) repeat protein
VRKSAFALLVVLSAAVLIPTERQLTRAFQRSAPHPELESYYQDRLARGGDAPDLLRELIRIRRQQADREGEIALRERLRRADPEDSKNLEELVDAYRWNNRADEAFGLADVLLRKDPERRELRELVLELAEHSGRLEEGHRHALWLVQHGVRSPRLVRASILSRDAGMIATLISSPVERSQALIAIGAQKEAIDACREQLLVEPGDLETKYRLAQLYRWNDRPMEAAAELEDILKVRDDPAIRREILTIYRGAGRIDLMLPYLPEGKEQADILLALGRTDEARELYRKLGLYENLLSLSRGSPSEDEEIRVRELMPMTEENRIRLADLYTWKKQFRKAVALYEQLGHERAVDLYLILGEYHNAVRVAQHLELHLKLGDLYLWGGEVEKAIVEYELAGGQELELARLYIRVGRKADAIRMLDRLKGEDPWILAELYIHAGGGDRAVAILREMDASEFDARRVEMILQAGDLRTQADLYRLLLERDPKNLKYLTALARVCEWMGDREGMIQALKQLLALQPNDAELCAKLGLLLNDRKLLERAAALGCKEPRIYRMLADIARQEHRPQDAIAYYRRYHQLDVGDAESHFALAELTGDAAEYELAWRLLGPGDRKIRIRILILRKDYEAAIALLKEERDWEPLVDLLFELKRFAEASKYPLTLRQQALVAYHLKRYAEAVKLLRQLDLSDPGLRIALGDSLFAQGEWQEAEEYASPELKKHIEGTYGAESSGDVQMLQGPLDHQVAAAARYRMYLGQPTYIRVQARARSLSGDIPALSESKSVQVEQADASVHFVVANWLRLSAGGGGWRSDLGSAPEGLAEIEVQKETWNAAVGARVNEPWIDSIRTAVLGGTASGAHAKTTIDAIPRRLILSGGIDQLWYKSREDLDLGLDGEQLSEFRARVRTEYRFLTGEGTTGKYFYDLALSDDSVIDSYLGVSVQGDFSSIRGSSSVMDFTQLPPRTAMLTLGPTAGWGNGTWGLAGTAFIGLDPARDIAFGKLWGGSAGIHVVPSDGWRVTSLFEYVSESRTTLKGATWTALLGLNVNF